LRQGDHYISVMLGDGTKLGQMIGIAIGPLAVAVFVSIQWIARTVRPPNPNFLLAIFVGAVVLILIFQRQVGVAFGLIVDNTITRFIDPKHKNEKSSGRSNRNLLLAKELFKFGFGEDVDS
jgi:hypothetical protein